MTRQLSTWVESTTLHFMRYSAQIRAARALLGWSQGQLARQAGIGLATLQRIEQTDGVVKGNFSTVLKIQKAFEEAGIRFMEDDSGEIGVRLKKETGPGVRRRKAPQREKRK
jgi:transcriptional regulator with XRE-family HTH domain